MFSSHLCGGTAGGPGARGSREERAESALSAGPPCQRSLASLSLCALLGPEHTLQSERHHVLPVPRGYTQRLLTVPGIKHVCDK